MNKIQDHFGNIQCHGEFSLMDEDTGSYGSSWLNRVSRNTSRTDPWSFQSALALRTIPYVGQFASYTGGGYVFEIDSNKTGALQELENQSWIDQYTRAVLLEFALYNPNVDLISVGMIFFEFTICGKVFPKYQFFTSKLYHYTGGLQVFVAICEALYVIYIIVFTRLEIKKFCGQKKEVYFRDTWNYVECAIIGLGYTSLALFIQRHVTVKCIVDEYVNQRNKFTSFYAAILWDYILIYVMAFLIFFVILKTLRLLRFNRRTLLLTSTVHYVRGSLLNFSVVFFICVLTFSFFAWLVFGYWVSDFRDFGHSLWSILHFLLGVSNYDKLEEANHSLGPLFFFMFTFGMQYCLITVFLAIVMEGFHTMHQSFRHMPPELPFTKFLMERLKLLLGVSKH